MEKKDLSAVYKLFKMQQEKYSFRYKLSQDELMFYILPRPEVVWTWVIENEVEVEDKQKGKIMKVQITDFFSMHVLYQKCIPPEVKHD